MNWFRLSFTSRSLDAALAINPLPALLRLHHGEGTLKSSWKFTDICQLSTACPSVALRPPQASVEETSHPSCKRMGHA